MGSDPNIIPRQKNVTAANILNRRSTMDYSINFNNNK